MGKGQHQLKHLKFPTNPNKKSPVCCRGFAVVFPAMDVGVAASAVAAAGLKLLSGLTELALLTKL